MLCGSKSKTPPKSRPRTTKSPSKFQESRKTCTWQKGPPNPHTPSLLVNSTLSPVILFTETDPTANQSSTRSSLTNSTTLLSRKILTETIRTMKTPLASMKEKEAGKDHTRTTLNRTTHTRNRIESPHTTNKVGTEDRTSIEEEISNLGKET